MKVVYMGTPDFAVAPLEALIEAGHEIVLVVTQPDKQKGRGKQVMMTPVKECALKYDIPVFQPVKIKTEESVAELSKYEADVFVVAAFGQILSQEILDMPKKGCFNIHASLLPKYRGAAPIQWVILDGEKETGVTIMRMDIGLDTGDMVAKSVIEIAPDETGESLHDKLAACGAKLIADVMPQIEAGTYTAEKQDDTKSCYAKMLTKSLGQIDFSRDAASIERLVRGLNSWPSAYTQLHGKTCKVWKAAVKEGMTDMAPGSVTEVSKDSITVQTGENQLVLLEVQLEGKKRVGVKDFLLGHTVSVGDVFGQEA